METILGLDVHGKKTMYIHKDQKGQVVGKGIVETSAEGLEEFCNKAEILPGTKIGMETGAQAFFVARQLQRLGMRPVVVHAREVRQKATRPKLKDDFRDAGEICDGLQRGYYEKVVHIPEAAIQELRDLLFSRRHFVRIRTAQVNAAKGIVRRVGLSKIIRSLSTEVGWEKLISRVATVGLGELCFVLTMHLNIWRAAGEQMSKVEEKIFQLVKEHEWIKSDLRLLKTIPGVGDIVGLTAIAVFSDISRFANAKKASSYAGLVTQTRHSGDKKRFGHITKTGSKELRAMLVEAAHNAGRPHQPLNPFFSKICAKKGYKVALVAVAHKLCRIIYAVLRDKVAFNTERVGVEKGYFVKTIVRPYQLKRTNQD